MWDGTFGVGAGEDYALLRFVSYVCVTVSTSATSYSGLRGYGLETPGMEVDPYTKKPYVHPSLITLEHIVMAVFALREKAFHIFNNVTPKIDDHPNDDIKLGCVIVEADMPGVSPSIDVLRGCASGRCHGTCALWTTWTLCKGVPGNELGVVGESSEGPISNRSERRIANAHRQHGRPVTTPCPTVGMYAWMYAWTTRGKYVQIDEDRELGHDPSYNRGVLIGV